MSDPGDRTPDLRVRADDRGPARGTAGTDPGTGRPAPGTGEAVLTARELRVWYGTEAGPVRAVDGVSFALLPGETLGLVGESGCGKSTLGRGVLGLLPRGAKVDGEIRYQHTDLVTARPRELQRLRGPDLGLIFQEPLTRLDPLMRISEHFEETLQAHEPGLSTEDSRHRMRHAFRNALVPFVTILGLQVALLLGGAILTEQTFNWPGIGSQLVRYLANRDYVAVQGVVTIFALAVVLASLLIDVINAMIDPRVRY